MHTSGPRTREHHSIGEGRIALVALLTVQAIVGYEWLISGLTKAARGGFVSGLAGDLRARSRDAAGWYRSFLDGSVIPNAHVFAYLIIIGELAVGIALIVAAALWLWRWERLSANVRVAVLGATALAALAGIFMNVAFHLANGASHPWVLPKAGFDEGVDLDALLILFEFVLLAASVDLLVVLRRSMRRGEQGAGAKPPPPHPAAMS